MNTELKNILEVCNINTKFYFNELINGKALDTMRKRRSNAKLNGDVVKYVDVTIAIKLFEIHKQTEACS